MSDRAIGESQRISIKRRDVSSYKAFQHKNGHISSVPYRHKTVIKSSHRGGDVKFLRKRVVYLQEA